MHRRRGMGIAATLILTAVVFLLAFTVAGIGFSHLNVSNRLSNLQQARNLAEAAVARGLEELMENNAFGTTGDADARSLTMTFTGAPAGSYGRLTFDTTRAAEWGLPVSVNNLSQEVTATGLNGRALPAHSVEIVAEGSCKGVTRRIDAVLYVPSYQWALASSGNLESTGGLFVASVEQLSDAANGVASSIPANKLLPGNLAANGSGNQALRLQSTAMQPSRITGDASTRGTAVIGANTTIGGVVKEHADPATLPDIDVTDFDPEGWIDLDEMTETEVGWPDEPYVLEGAVRRDGNLTVTEGGLKLEGGYLYVDGDLTINGGLSGKGAIFATGNITINGQSSFEADSIQAVIAQGDLTVDGGGKDTSCFTGIAYSEGDFSASDVTIVGSFTANKASGGGSQVELTRVSVLQVPEAVEFKFPFPSRGIYGMKTSGLMNDINSYAVIDPEFDLGAYYDPVTDTFAFNSEVAEVTPITYFIQCSSMMMDEEGNMTSVYEADTLESVAQKVLVSMQGQNLPTLEEVVEQARQERDEYLQNVLTNLNDFYQESRQTTGNFRMDPNSFVSVADKVRIVQWREL